MKAQVHILGETQRAYAISLIQGLPIDLVHTIDINVRKKIRNLPQNDRLHAMIRDVATQVEWYGRYVGEDDWKTIFTAAWKNQDVVPGINGGFVVLGVKTSKMTEAEASELIELVMAFGCQHNVKWKDPKLQEE